MRRVTEEEWREAITIWKELHPEETTIEKDATVKLKSGREVNIGRRIRTIKVHLSKLTEEQKEFWRPFLAGRITEKEYREALELWKELHPGKTEIKKDETVKLESGREVNLGKRIACLKDHFHRLKEEEKEIWYPFTHIIPSEEEYRQAAEIWKQNHPEKKCIPQNAVVTIPSGKKIQLGTRVAHMKNNIVKLTEEQQKFWAENYNLYESERRNHTAQEWQEARITWRYQNPDAFKINFADKVQISSGEIMDIGIKVANVKRCKDQLPEEEKRIWELYNIFPEQAEHKYWTQMRRGSYEISKKQLNKEIIGEKYKKAYEIWKTEYPDETKVPADLKIEKENGKSISLGYYITRIQQKPHLFSEEEKDYWRFQGVIKTPKRNMNYKFYQQASLKAVLDHYQGILSEKKTYWILKCLKDTRKKAVQDQKIPQEEEKLEQIKRFQVLFPKDTLDQQISRLERMKTDSPTAPSGWIYEKYGSHISTILKYLDLDEINMLREMTDQMISLEEVMQHEVFLSVNTNSRYDWLEVPFQFLLTKTEKEVSLPKLNRITYLFAQKYHLDREEIQVLQDSLHQYNTKMLEFQKLEVGFESDKARKLEKIVDYQLSSDDIEESFFLPLELNGCYITEKNQELYNRKCLLKQYVIDWNFYSDEEKKTLINREKMTREEVYHIEFMRAQIDEAVALADSSKSVQKTLRK